jgi:hypothetical protein
VASLGAIQKWPDWIILIVLIFLLGYQADSDSKGSLHGIVTDPAEAVVSAATVEIMADVPGEQQNRIVVNTNYDGKFTSALTAGQYRVCVRSKGFEEICHCVRIEEGRDAQINFSLRMDKARVLPDYDVMKQRLQLLASEDAIDCGHVSVRESPRKETACSLGAYRRRKPFYVRYNVLCGDCLMSLGLAADSLGRLFAVSFDSMGMNADQRDTAETMPDHPVWFR